MDKTKKVLLNAKSVIERGSAVKKKKTSGIIKKVFKRMHIRPD